jgi:hypothetical protein
VSKPTLLQDRFDRGAKQDVPRNYQQAGVVWKLTDYLPSPEAPAQKRGGTTYASPDLSAASASSASASYVQWVTYVNFSAGAQLVACDEDGRSYRVVSSTSAVDLSTGNASLQNPVLHDDKLIIPSADGSTSVKRYTGSGTIAALSGSPPPGRYAAVYKDRTCLANSASQMTYVYFSGAADPESWDTTNGWQSVGSPVTGLASLPNALMVFQADRTSRIRGSIPPPGSDMIVDDPIFAVGCTDARSIAVAGQYAFFANPLGVWRTNGTNTPENLTATVGLARYWRELLASYSSSWTLAGGVYGDLYIIFVMNGASFVDAIAFDTRRFSAWFLSNIKGVCCDNATTVGEELYVGLRNTPRVVKLSPIFSPSDSVKNDADGAAVTPTMESLFYVGKAGQKRIGDLYITYDMRDAAADNPTLTVSYLTDPEGSYTALTTTLAETSGRTRAKIPLNIRTETFALKIAQSNASSDTRIYRAEAEVAALEAGRTR